MNSIEVSSNPERKGAQPMVEQPVLRVFVKEANAYTLQYETRDFQQAMKQAGKFADKGKDILVNEKDNPTVVHAKSNFSKDVDVGREVRPAKKDGAFHKGPGDIVLPSFYVKLPLDTKTFDQREMASGEPGKGAVDLAKSPARPLVGDATLKVSAPAKEAAVPELAQDTQKARAALDAPEAGPKVILSKTGYELPESVVGGYTVKDGKFNDKDSNALRFEDHGKKLSTPVEDRKVIADMISVAAAKNWDTLELKGTETFKQLAWLEAESRGIQTKGYTPNERDLEQLDKLRQERGGINGLTDKQLNDRTLNSVSPVFEREHAKTAPDRADVAASVKAVAGMAEAAPGVRMASGTMTAAKDVADEAKGKEAEKVDPKKANTAPADKAEPGHRIESGKLVEHGPAKYKFDPDEKDSYYVKLDTGKGEKTVWGKDLERAITAGKFKQGDPVSLEFKGAKDVVVDANIRDKAGKVVGTQPVEAQLNKWEAKAYELKVTRVLSPDEQSRVDAASKILEKHLAKVPEQVRKDVLAQVTTALDKGELKLPSVKVMERSTDKASPAPTPNMDRSR